MDTTRYFPPPEKPCPSFSAAQYAQTAERLIGQCVDYYKSHEQRSIGSLYCGALGPLVYARYRLALRIQGTDKKRAHDIMAEALAVVEASLRYERKRSTFRVTLLEGAWVGAKTIKCAILFHLDKKEEAFSHTEALLRVLEEKCEALAPSECEVLYGRAGAIQVILFLRQQMQDNSLGRDLAMKLASEIVQEGRSCSQRYNSSLPLLWTWHNTAYLGAAHGIVGILHTLLYLKSEELSSVGQTLQVNVHDLIQQTIDGLDELCFPSGNLRSSIDSNSDRLVHWCHGAPGHVMLLAKASIVYRNSLYLDRAKDIATNVIMKRGLLRKGVGLCHGISGNAYSLLTIGRTDRDPKWMHRGKSFAHFALHHLNELEMIPDRPYSLYEGCAGLAVLLLDLCNPDASAFPLYEFI